MDAKGELSEADLKTIDVDSRVNRNGKKCIDLLVLNRRRSVLLTHPTIAAKETKTAVVEVPELRPKRKATSEASRANKLARK